MKVFFLFIIIAIMVFIVFSLFSGAAAGSPTAEQGLLNLEDWDFNERGPAELHGEWSFYWREMLTSPDLAESEATYITIPSYWNSHTVDGEKLPGKGFATYCLRILLPANSENIALSLNNIATSYTIFIDGTEYKSVGVTGETSETYTPDYAHITLPVASAGNEIGIAIQVSNFAIKKGGIWDAILIGTEKSLSKNRENIIIFDVFLISFILCMGLYHIGIYLHRHQDRTSLYFGIFCILITVRSLVTGEIIFRNIFPDISWYNLIKIEFLTFYIALPVFLMYIRNLLPDDFNIIILRIAQAAGILFSIVVLFTKPGIFAYTDQIYQVFTILCGCYVVWVLILAIRHRRKSSLELLLGFMFMFIVVINDILYSNEVIHSGLFMPAGLLVFILSQALLILDRLSHLFRTVENQRNELLRSRQQFERSRLGTILGLAKLAEYRDHDTGAHLERIREYCKIIAAELARTGKYRGYITERYISDLYQSSILHDIGKVGVADSILLKTSKLDEHEFLEIQKHTQIGGDALTNIENQIEMKSFLTLGKEIAYYHHERWDGKGYPKGLKEEQIPLSARITALADVYDALTSVRPYKTAFSHNKAASIIKEGRGTHFDPDIVDIFVLTEDSFKQIRKLLNDEQLLDSVK